MKRIVFFMALLISVFLFAYINNVYASVNTSISVSQIQSFISSRYGFINSTVLCTIPSHREYIANASLVLTQDIVLFWQNPNSLPPQPPPEWSVSGANSSYCIIDTATSLQVNITDGYYLSFNVSFSSSWGYGWKAVNTSSMCQSVLALDSPSYLASDVTFTFLADESTFMVIQSQNFTYGIYDNSSKKCFDVSDGNLTFPTNWDIITVGNATGSPIGANQTNPINIYFSQTTFWFGFSDFNSSTDAYANDAVYDAYGTSKTLQPSIDVDTANAQASPSGVVQINDKTAIYIEQNTFSFFWDCFTGVNENQTHDAYGSFTSRYCSGLAYPELLSYYTLNITALNVQNGSNISVPMKINDVEYYTPISASLTSGIYIVQPENLGFNSTHYWRFMNWTDGADRTRTINFTGPASYTAYYQLTKIQSWGGYFNFFLGLAGLGMMASSWFVLKWQWDEKNYGVAILTWMLLLIVGFALCTILFGG